MAELVVFGKKVRISDDLDLALTILANTLGISKEELAEGYLKSRGGNPRLEDETLIEERLRDVPIVKMVLEHLRELEGPVECSVCGRVLRRELIFKSDKGPLCLKCWSERLAGELKDYPIGLD